MNIYFDFDGVLTTNKSGFMLFCENISKKTQISLEKVMECYGRYADDIYTGRKVYSDIWEGFCQCLGKEIEFSSEFFETGKNEEMFALVRALREKGHFLGIISDNSKERADFVVAKFGLGELFDQVILSSEEGCMKTDKEIFKDVHKPAIFIDNSEKNLIVPKELGIKTIYYEENSSVEALKEIIF